MKVEWITLRSITSLNLYFHHACSFTRGCLFTDAILAQIHVFNYTNCFVQQNEEFESGIATAILL